MLMSRLKTQQQKWVKLSNLGGQGLVDQNAYTLDDVEQERQRIHQQITSLSSVLDSSGQHRILSFISTSSVLANSKWKLSALNMLETSEGTGSYRYRNDDVSLASHASIDQLHYLLSLTQRWHGLISISLFVATLQQLSMAVEVILLLRYCNFDVRHKTSFHLVYPLSLTAEFNSYKGDSWKWSSMLELNLYSRSFVSNENCKNIQSSIRNLIKPSSTNYNHRVPYPNNLLRNVARRYASTEYTLVIDIDLMPSANLYEDFIEFILRRKQESENDDRKVIFVVPTFEIDLKQSGSLDEKDRLKLFPSDKHELIEQIQNKTVRPFYMELCWKCQKYTDYEAWLHESLEQPSNVSSRMNILYYVEWHDPWEPFYISHNSAPLYDERFQQYGFNRISQVRVARFLVCFKFHSRSPGM